MTVLKHLNNIYRAGARFSPSQIRFYDILFICKYSSNSLIHTLYNHINKACHEGVGVYGTRTLLF
jgi:hypothetical protein